MTDKGLTDQALRESLLDAAMAHVAFDGWTEAAFRAAAADAGVSVARARVTCPRGALDLAVDYHKRGDAAMVAGLAGLNHLRFRDRVARAVRLRLETADRELVRRGAALFALPQHAATGAALIWGTADAIWTALGDTSEDVNWYTKRATLAAVYSATVLYWLGDDSEGQADTWDFLDRRIAGVMRFETAKARLRENRLFTGLMRPLSGIRRPGPPPEGLPGRVRS